ncbi:hypothetical protein ABZS66_37615 [Dactylosporangium sp. NPDC005572]|uniref:hypothetical protein n=1 Tax=Dactylosporangium sp. NPDC005572 TaxID=3156889 RepID=UPI0033B66FC8
MGAGHPRPGEGRPPPRDEEELAGLTEDLRATLRTRAVPSPAGVLSDRQHLHDPARYDVPVTAVSTDFTSAMLRGWIEQAAPPVREYAHIRTVHHVDLPAGHWPQLTRPDDLAAVIVAAVSQDREPSQDSGPGK